MLRKVPLGKVMPLEILGNRPLLLGGLSDADDRGIADLLCGGGRCEESGYRGDGGPRSLEEGQPGHGGQAAVDWRHSVWAIEAPGCWILVVAQKVDVEPQALMVGLES